MQGPRGLILDAGCGYGRNAVALAKEGASVICLDRDRRRLEKLINLASGPQVELLGDLYLVCADVRAWPFPKSCFSAIVCVHIIVNGLLDRCHHSLMTSGYLYFETFGNHGQNYLDLPKAGQIRAQLKEDFDFLDYRERKAGPTSCDAVSVTLMARKRT
jgi:SAM-dependent methyltransferase